MDLSKLAAASLSYEKVVETYKNAAAMATAVTAYAVLARGMARELLPQELRDAACWAVAQLLRGRVGRREPDRHTFVIRRHDEEGDGALFSDARAYLATRIDPHGMRRVCLGRRRCGTDDGADGRHVLSMEVGDSISDVFEGIEFTWTSVGESEGHFRNKEEVSALELSFDAEHTDVALKRYVPFVTASVEAARLRDRTLEIFSSQVGTWHGSKYLHPATFDTVAMDPALKHAIVDDLDRFVKRKDYYRRIGKAWKRGYLLYGPPGTGKSSLVAAIANYLRFNIYDLDLSNVHSNYTLQWLLTSMSNKSILVVEDIDCCFNARSRCGPKKSGDKEADEHPSDGQDAPQDTFTGHGITLSGLLNFIDGLWSTSGEERIIIFTTNYKDRLDPALLRPGRMDMHVYMGHCGWEALKTLARNYFLVDDHKMFPEIQELLSAVEVTPAVVSEMLLRSEDVDVALRGLAKFLDEKKQGKQKGETEKA